jgi:type 1 glutamine amidotransferase
MTLLTLVCLVITACSAPPSQEPPASQEPPVALNAEEQADGFQPLFDGRSLAGWRGFRNTELPDSWVVERGTLHFRPVGGRGDLVTVEQFGDFELRLEWKISEGGNSGIMFRVTEEQNRPWKTGPEMQVLDDAGHRDGQNPETSAGANYALHAPTSQAVRPVGEWNEVRLRVQGPRVEHWLNGRLIVDYRLWSPEWEARVRETRFAQHPDYGRSRTGHIALQDHGNEVWFRNLRIRPLEAYEPDPAEPAILVFSRTAGFRHGSIPAGTEAIRELGRLHGFRVDATEDPARFAPETLAGYDAVVFLNTTGDVLNQGQQAALEAYLESGRGFVGVHAATDCEYDWPWYGDLVGAYFASHPAVQEARIEIRDRSHPSTAHLPGEWRRTDEWYDFREPLDPGVSVLLSLDESSYDGGQMGEHPIAWYHEYGGGRAWYTGFGHTDDTFREPLVLEHLLGGIEWAAGFQEGEARGH